jgi:aspartyl protease family protein
VNKIILLLLVFVLTRHCIAAEEVQVQALFPGKAMLSIDGETKVLATGQSFAGVKMISAGSHETVLEIDGVQAVYTTGSAISTSYQKQIHLREQIMADTRGMFYTHGSINGRSARFLIDTGATSVAMSASDAKKLVIQYRLDGNPTQVTTASGVARAWHVKLRSVKLGKLEQKNIDAVVIEGDYPKEILLGMTFLERLKVTKESGKMTIEQKTSALAPE